jgi:tellurite resistance protein TerC
VAIITRFDWMFYVLGVFLIFTGIKMVFVEDEGVHPEKNMAIRLVRKILPVSPDFNGQKFFTTFGGQTALSPLALVLLMVETTDLIFAVDSIPAIFGVTKNAYIVFTSNVFAILGLRSLYFVLAGAIQYFRFLKIGLSFVLVFIGVKMLLVHTEYAIPTTASLVVVALIIIFSVLASVAAVRRDRARARREDAAPPPDHS